VFNGELDNCHYDTPKPAEKKKKLDIFYDMCIYRQALLKIISLDSSTAQNILLFYQIWYLNINVGVFPELFKFLRLDKFEEICKHSLLKFQWALC
jgi:hypothetical protein